MVYLSHRLLVKHRPTLTGLTTKVLGGARRNAVLRTNEYPHMHVFLPLATVAKARLALWQPECSAAMALACKHPPPARSLIYLAAVWTAALAPLLLSAAACPTTPVMRPTSSAQRLCSITHSRRVKPLISPTLSASR